MSARWNYACRKTEPGRFSTEPLSATSDPRKPWVGALAEMYVQGVPTRRGKAVTEALCGHEFSASASSYINKTLDEALLAGNRFAEAA